MVRSPFSYTVFTVQLSQLTPFYTSNSYIIDFEDARPRRDSDTRETFIPELDWRVWGIAGPGYNCSMYGLDPMVPYDGEFIRDPDDETLEKWAADAAGKEVHFPVWKMPKLSTQDKS